MGELITAKTLLDHFNAEFREAFPKSKPPRFEMKYMKLLKFLNTEQGGERSLSYIEFVCRNWSLVSKKCKITGYPNISILWGFRSSLLALFDEGVNRNNSVEYKNGTPKSSEKINTKQLFLDR